MTKQDLKDHFWSSIEGAGIAAGAVAAIFTAVVAAGSAGSAPTVAGIATAVVAGTVAGTAIVTGAVAGSVVAGDKADDFKHISAIGGAILSASAIFGVAHHYGGFEQSAAMKPSEHAPSSEMVIDQAQRSNVAQYFNENDDHPHVTAEINQQGNYLLTVKPKALALSLSA